MKPAAVFGALGVGVVLTGAVAIGDAVACGGAMLSAPARRVMLLATMRDAQNELEKGNYRRAAAFLRRASPFPDTALERGLRLKARLVARTDGDYDAHADDEGSQYRANIEWAAGVMESLAEKQPADPRVLTDLGEVLSKHPRYHARAKALLERLAERDLITTAHGWKALAELRGGSHEALARCRLMALDPDRVCDDKEPPRQGQPPKIVTPTS